MFGESFYNCFSRLKRPSHSSPTSIPSSPNASSATATSSSSSSSSSSSASASASAVVFKNFNSLYDTISDSETAVTLTLSASAPARSSFSSSSDCPEDPDGGAVSPPSERELSKAIASRRLLLASPGRSNSIVDSAVVSVVVGKGLAVQKFSPDPYREFRRSMEEMVAALGLDAAAHRAHLHELLLCYLALNQKHAHKYIVGAFADLLLSLSEEAGNAGVPT